MSNEQQEVLDGLKRAIERAYEAGKADAAKGGVTVPHYDLATFLHCSINYAVGRRTYMSDLVPELVRTYWQGISQQMQTTLARNLESDIRGYDQADRKIGDECDDRSWRELLAWMQEQIAKDVP